MKTKNKFTTSQLTVLGLMSGILLLMAYTPLGYLNIGPLAISFNVIPVAVSAVVLGPVGGAVTGAIFGLTSFGQCIGIGGTSAMGAVLFGISPVLAFLQRFISNFAADFFESVCACAGNRYGRCGYGNVLQKNKDTESGRGSSGLRYFVYGTFRNVRFHVSSS